MDLSEYSDDELAAELLRRRLVQEEIQRQIWTGEREVTDGDSIHDDPRSWKHQ